MKKSTSRKVASVLERLIELELKRKRLQREADDLDKQIQELENESLAFPTFTEYRFVFKKKLKRSER